MAHIEKQFPWTRVIIIVLFALSLIVFRLIWISAFTDPKQQEITNGELDLSNWDFSDEKSIALSGDWEFHPYVLLEKAPTNHENKPRYIQVPSDWSTVLNEEDGSPYGHGSYRLRIYVDPDTTSSFSMRIPSVRSASALYANGLLVGKSGEVGESEVDSRAWNVPYSSTSIRPDDSGVIELVLQATNYVDPRSSGFVRSVKFGYEDDVKTETELSTILQVITAVILFVHALFACLIFLVGIRDRRLLYFSIAILSLMFINLTGGDEKVLYQYIEIGYIRSYKLSMLVMFLLSWSLVHCVGPQIKAISRKFLTVYNILFVLMSIVTFLLPMNYLASASKFTFGAVFVASIITIGTLLWSRKKIQGGIWISLSIVAITSHYIWWAYTMATGVKIVYYPFDLVIAIFCLAGVWFKQYNQMYEESKVQAAKLLEAAKDKDEFLANTSHELRNPLHSILNMSEGVLEREGRSLQIESVKNLETVLSVGRRMSFILTDLLDLTRLKDGNSTLELQPISLQAITAGVMDMLEYKLEEKSVQMINDIPSDFPAVMGDENRTIQIMFNLVHNAIKFTPSGEVVIQAKTQGDMALISVKDTGIGINPETLATIFDSYKQGNADESMIEGGFGLGLNISKKLVRLHGGTLRVKSNVGKGSIFTFSLQVADSQVVSEAGISASFTSILKVPVEEVAEAKSINTEQTELREDNPRIIVVDDDPVNLEVMKTILSIEKYEITSVLSGKAAVDLLDAREWDLIISDVMMPQMSGYELTRIIRKRFTMSELPILLLTARSSPEDIESGFSSGANDYVTKPVDAVELRSRVKALTQVRQSAREQMRMESAWMQAQMQPHFLFNTINSIIALSEIDTKRMQRLLYAFSNVLRGKFNFKNIDEFVSIAHELSIIRSYLHIEKERFGERLEVTWDVDESIQVKIPALSIQPLVENAIRHGIMKRARGGKIILKVIDCQTHLKVVVEDDGVGIENHQLKQILKSERGSKSGVGLLNTNLRLQRLFGEGLQIESTVDYGTTVSFTVPYGQE